MVTDNTTAQWTTSLPTAQPTYVITGINGTIGTAVVNALQSTGIGAEQIIGLSNDEDGLERVRRVRGIYTYLADIRDSPRLHDVFDNISCRWANVHVIHCAALKHVGACERHPAEAIETNIRGTQNLINACAANGVLRFLFVSTDKAVNPTNLMGHTKAIGEVLTLEAFYRDRMDSAVVRFGNVLGSRGSLLEIWREKVAAGEELPLTDHRCARYMITPEEAGQFIVDRLNHMEGGRIYIPILPLFTLSDFAAAFLLVNDRGRVEVEEIGLRSGEKLVEEMMSEYEGRMAIVREDYIELVREYYEQAATHEPITYPQKQLSEGQLYRLLREA